MHVTVYIIKNEKSDDTHAGMYMSFFNLSTAHIR